jgi:hypothetical protein
MEESCQCSDIARLLIHNTFAFPLLDAYITPFQQYSYLASSFVMVILPYPINHFPH